MNIHEERIRVARMTAACCEIQHNPGSPPAERFAALLWVPEVGECIVGHGPDEWTAVQSAHALAELARGRGSSYWSPAFR